MFKNNQDTSQFQLFENTSYDVVALASSAGGLNALSILLSSLPGEFPISVVVVQHLDPRHRSLMADILSRRTPLTVNQACEGDRLKGGHVYIAPPDRHLLVVRGGILTLTQSSWCTSCARRRIYFSNRWRRASKSAPLLWCSPAPAAMAAWVSKPSRPWAAP